MEAVVAFHPEKINGALPSEEADQLLRFRAVQVKKSSDGLIPRGERGEISSLLYQQPNCPRVSAGEEQMVSEFNRTIAKQIVWWSIKTLTYA